MNNSAERSYCSLFEVCEDNEKLYFARLLDYKGDTWFPIEKVQTHISDCKLGYRFPDFDQNKELGDTAIYNWQSIKNNKNPKKYFIDAVEIIDFHDFPVVVFPVENLDAENDGFIGLFRFLKSPTFNFLLNLPTFFCFRNKNQNNYQGFIIEENMIVEGDDGYRIEFASKPIYAATVSAAEILNAKPNRLFVNRKSLKGLKKFITRERNEIITELVMKRFKTAERNHDNPLENETDWDKAKILFERIVHDDWLNIELAKALECSIPNAKSFLDKYFESKQFYLKDMGLETKYLCQIALYDEKFYSQCYQSVEEKWNQENKPALEKHKQELEEVALEKTQAEKDLNLIRQELETTALLIKEKAGEAETFEQLLSETKQKIADLIAEAKNDMAGLLAKSAIYSEFFPGPEAIINTPYIESPIYWVPTNNKYDGEIFENKNAQEEIEAISINLAGEESQEGDLWDLLAAFLHFSQNISIPVLLVGPDTTRILEGYSYAFQGKDYGRLSVRSDSRSGDVISQVDENNKVVMLEDFRGNLKLAEELAGKRPDLMVCGSIQCPEELSLEPKSFFRYCIPVMTEVFETGFRNYDFELSNRAEAFAETEERRPSQLLLREYEQFRLPPAQIKILRSVLSRVKSIVSGSNSSSNSDDGIRKYSGVDVELLFLILPYSIVLNKIEVLKEVLNHHQAEISDDIFKLASCYLDE